MKTVGLIVTIMALATVSGAAEDERPNILFAIADDWGWPHAGAYGDRVVATPNFDSLAREGVLFDAAFVSSPSCTPSRNAILTGQAFFRLGQGANLWSTLAPEHQVYPRMLEDAGYFIGHWRKAWGPGNFKALGRERNPAGKQFKSFDEFLEARPKGTPFCFWLGAHDPHRGYRPGSGAASGMDLAAIDLPPPYPDAMEIRSDIADYYYEVQRFDADVGRALELLRKNGELDNTIVVMTGDHGWPFPRGKTNLYDLGSRVPMVIRWGSRVEGGRTVKAPISLTDLAPTFLEAGGLSPAPRMTGRSLVDLLTSSEVEPDRTHVVFGRERHTLAQKDHKGGYPMRGVRTERFLFIRNLRPGDWPSGWEAPGKRPFRDCDNGPTKSWIMEHRDEYPEAFALCFGKRPSEELFAIEEDPFQLRNLAQDPEYEDVRERLAALLDSELERLEDPRRLGGEIPFDEAPYRDRRR